MNYHKTKYIIRMQDDTWKAKDMTKNLVALLGTLLWGQGLLFEFSSILGILWRTQLPRNPWARLLVKGLSNFGSNEGGTGDIPSIWHFYNFCLKPLMKVVNLSLPYAFTWTQQQGLKSVLSGHYCTYFIHGSKGLDFHILIVFRTDELRVKFAIISP